MRNHKLIIVAALLIYGLCILPGCQYNRCISCEIKDMSEKQKLEKQSKEDAQLALQREKRLEALRKQIGLTPLFEKWHHVLRNERIRQLYIIENILLVETDSKRIFAFDRTTGIPLWIYTMGDPLDFKPVIYKDLIYFVGMAKLHILDKTSGNVLVKQALSFVPASAPYVNDNYIYIGAWDNFLYALQSKTGDYEWRYRIDGLIWGQPIVIDGILFFAGTDSRIYSINASSGDTMTQWAAKGRYTTRGPNVSGPIGQIDPPVVYVGSRDYNLYSLNRITGELRWKFESGGEIAQSPIVSGSTIYVTSNRTKKDGYFYAVNLETGEPKWAIDHGITLFFIGNRHNWILKNNQKIVCVENETGKVKNNFDLNGFDFFVTNANDNCGYMSTEDGYIFSVEER